MTRLIGGRAEILLRTLFISATFVPDEGSFIRKPQTEYFYGELRELPVHLLKEFAICYLLCSSNILIRYKLTYIAIATSVSLDLDESGSSPEQRGRSFPWILSGSLPLEVLHRGEILKNQLLPVIVLREGMNSFALMDGYLRVEAVRRVWV